MKKLMLTAMQSGAGKTVTVCALMAALKKRGLSVRAFKCGPDYIDPMFHTRVLGVPGRNLDLFLQGAEGVKRTLLREDCDIAVVEGAMGYYDGMNGTERASAWEIAAVTGTPSILILKPGGSSITLAAQVHGMLTFRRPSGIVGLLLVNCTGKNAEHVSPILERETGLPVLGYLPVMQEAQIKNRYLGLLTPDEVTDLKERFRRIAAQMEKTVDLERLLSLAVEEEISQERDTVQKIRCRIAVARDEAFCFRYADSMDALREAGAEPVFFSPLADRSLPEGADGLYLCGGYPELYGSRLSRNEEMRRSIRDAVLRGVPTIAECGGFLYLQESLKDGDGVAYAMCGVLPGEGFRTGHLQRFGYEWLQGGDSMLFRQGERVPAHEFHYYDCTENGSDLTAEKADGRSWPCAFTSDHLYAGFPHLHLGGEPPLAERFVEACVRFGNGSEKRREW